MLVGGRGDSSSINSSTSIRVVGMVAQGEGEGGMGSCKIGGRITKAVVTMLDFMAVGVVAVGISRYRNSDFCCRDRIFIINSRSSIIVLLRHIYIWF